MTIESVLGTMNHVSTGQECARAVLIFLYGLVILRLSGRRTFAKWSALDIIVSIIAGSALSRAMTGSAPLAGTLAAVAVLTFLHWVFAHASARSAFVSNLLEGSPVVLARNGAEPQPATLQEHAISENDLNEGLRQSGVESASQARLVTLEPSGKVTVIKA
jgi:uncharacterized membrane protein YcaP (DUF421 family)